MNFFNVVEVSLASSEIEGLVVVVLVDSSLGSRDISSINTQTDMTFSPAPPLIPSKLFLNPVPFQIISFRLSI